MRKAPSDFDYLSEYFLDQSVHIVEHLLPLLVPVHTVDDVELVVPGLNLRPAVLEPHQSTTQQNLLRHIQCALNILRNPQPQPL